MINGIYMVNNRKTSNRTNAQTPTRKHEHRSLPFYEAKFSEKGRLTHRDLFPKISKLEFIAGEFRPQEFPNDVRGGMRRKLC